LVGAFADGVGVARVVVQPRLALFDLDRADANARRTVAPDALVGLEDDEPRLVGRGLAVLVVRGADVGQVAGNRVHPRPLGYQAAGADVEGRDHGQWPVLVVSG
jgi:hypothetical protein